MSMRYKIKHQDNTHKVSGITFKEKLRHARLRARVLKDDPMYIAMLEYLENELENQTDKGYLIVSEKK